MQSTPIEYLTHTWNPIAMRCTPVSEGCANCWHLKMANRLRGYFGKCPAEIKNCYRRHHAYNGGDPWLHTDELAAPFRLKKPTIIGVQFMGDLFHESLANEQIAAVFGVMAATPQHQYVILTKRLRRAVEWFDWIQTRDVVDGMSWAHYHCVGYMQHAINEIKTLVTRFAPWPLPNLIMCASVEDQPSADERVPLLLQIPAIKRGISVEPMLGPVATHEITIREDWIFNALDTGNPYGAKLDLAICGAETGPGKRPFKDEWALDLRDQCRVAGTPFFFKKDGQGNGTLCGVEYHEWPGD